MCEAEVISIMGNIMKQKYAFSCHLLALNLGLLDIRARIKLNQWNWPNFIIIIIFIMLMQKHKILWFLLYFRVFLFSFRELFESFNAQ
jgi:hypothetical protein